MGYVTVKLLLLAPFPPGVTTVIGPVVAPAGTVALISVYDFTLNNAAFPLKRTLVAPVNAVPSIVTSLPGGPDSRVTITKFRSTTIDYSSDPGPVVVEPLSRWIRPVHDP